ncbi:MAG: hypothetical protein FJ291_12520 [Planctomycetes bacterium]|nr:hypothetical protein [Planctomycetota bacterium]
MSVSASAAGRAMGPWLGITLWVVAACRPAFAAQIQPDAKARAKGATLKDKTLVAWVSPANLTQRGGSVLTLENPGGVFDALVFGEYQPAKWMLGSDYGRRCHRQQDAWPAETAGPTTVVQIALVCRGREVALYRNGQPYASYTMASDPIAFDQSSTVLMGLRHVDAGRPNCFFTGTIEDARIYDTALDAKTIAALKPNEPSEPKPFAWWTFQSGKAEDAMGRFPAGQLVDGATISEGKLHLPGPSSYMIAETVVPVDLTTLYHERLRPQFHFTARQWTRHRLNPGPHEEGWINDVNGLFYLDGEYHLFAQRWWSCWLHAISKDLIHWEEVQPAFGKGGKFGGTQSGSAVVDANNTSGLATSKDTPAIVAFWSSTDNLNQCISYSNDRGRTWTKWDKNPVLAHPERDPRVFWYEAGKKWVMILSGPGNTYVLFDSTNLTSWRKLSTLKGFFECPDMFPLPVDGDRSRTKWVVIGGDGSYTVGDFDGMTFKPDAEPRRTSGPHFYATQTWNHIPEKDGRRIQIAWMRGGKYPNMPFNQQHTFPCELTLRTVGGTARLFRKPIAEIATLHKSKAEEKTRTLAAGEELKLAAKGDLFHILAELEMEAGAEAAFRIRGETLAFTSDKLSIQGFTAPMAPDPKRLRLELLVDRTSIEAFGNDGEASLSACFLPSDAPLALKCTRGTLKVVSLTIHELASIWRGAPKAQ